MHAKIAFGLALTSLTTVLHAQVPLAGGSPAVPTIQLISSTASRPWQPSARAIIPARIAWVGVVRIDPSIRYQSIDGFGGCFNELGWDALQAVGPAQRGEALRALFDSSGCHFTNCRMGIGANDFARGWYSFDETPHDFAMSRFSIARDKTILIPYIKAAMKDAPELKIWGVPWSPPAWMKVNHSYENDAIRMEPKVLAAYALYFSKYVQAYRAEGIDVYAVHPQNEPSTGGDKYPKCRWNGRDLRTFVRDYLVPRLRRDGVKVEVWLGTLNDGNMDDFTNLFLGDPATAAMITGVGYQYGGQDAFGDTHAKYPGKKMMETETECDHGDNNWDEAMGTFNHIAKDLNHFANGYDFWNLILNKKRTSTWGWRQNSLLILDARKQRVIYNPDFYALKHFAHFVQNGARRIKISGIGIPKSIAFQNPDGEIIVAFSNDRSTARKVILQLGGRRCRFNVPPRSMNTAVLTGW